MHVIWRASRTCSRTKDLRGRVATAAPPELQPIMTQKYATLEGIEMYSHHKNTKRARAAEKEVFRCRPALMKPPWSDTHQGQKLIC